MEVKVLRRNNLRKLAFRLGGISALARQLAKTPAQLSHLIGSNFSKNIGDRLAHSIEQTLGLPPGWLDTAHSDEDINFYEESCLSVSSVPLLEGNEILLWIQKPNRSLLKRKVQYIRTTLQLSRHAFAMQVQNDLMEAPRGLSFPCGCIVIADPELPSKNGDYVIISLDKSTPPHFRQLIQEGSRRYLKPLNLNYPIIELTSPTYLICGILRQAIITP